MGMKNRPWRATDRKVAGTVLPVLAGGGIQALTAAAGPLTQLLFTGRVAEIGGWAAYIVNVALEILVLDHQLRFPENGLMAAGLDNAALVEGQCAEGAGAEAAPVADQAEFDFLNGRNAAGLGIAGVPGAHIGKIVDGVHFLGGQRLLRRILDYIFLAAGLRQAFGSEGITVAVLDPEALGIAALGFFQLLVGRKHNGGKAFIQLRCSVDSAVDIGNVPDIHTGIQGIRHIVVCVFLISSKKSTL